MSLGLKPFCRRAATYQDLGDVPEDVDRGLRGGLLVLFLWRRHVWACLSGGVASWVLWDCVVALCRGWWSARCEVVRRGGPGLLRLTVWKHVYRPTVITQDFDVDSET